MDRRAFLKTLSAAGAGALLPGILTQPGCRKSTVKPNIIVFLADDLGYGDLACYGNPIIKTPSLDRLAAEGMRFTDCHSAGTVCSPSRAALLTGRNPFRVGFYYLTGGGAHLRREEITVAAALKRAGYDTCFVGKWHVGELDDPERGQPTPGDHGFDHWFATELNAFEGPENPTSFIRNGQRVDRTRGWYCDLIVEEAVRWMESRRDSGRPFFALVCSHEPHAPLEPPESYSAMYEGSEIDRLARSLKYGGVERNREEIFPLKKYYYGTVTQLDAAFGRLMEAVDGMGLRDETFVLFTSDNGPETPPDYRPRPGEDMPAWVRRTQRCFGTPGVLRGMKRYTYEGGHRVPGIIRWPGHIPAGAESDALINGTDIFPTLCELAGAPLPVDRPLDGVSVLPVLRGKNVSREVAAFWMFPAGYSGFPHMAMREDHYVLLGWFNEKNRDQLWMDYVKTARLERYELYDLGKDLEQQNDLAGGRPELVRALSSKMTSLWADVQAEGPVWPDWTRK
jgi:arylsulfatase A